VKIGILKQADKAKEQTEKSSELEKIKMAATSAIMKDNGNIQKVNLEKELEDVYPDLNISERLVENEIYIFKGTYAEYLIFKDGTVEEKQDYSNLKVGDWINYPVYYENQIECDDNYNSWRIVDINYENNTIKIISEGIPVKYRYILNETKNCVKNLNVNLFDNEDVFIYGFKDNNNETNVTTNAQMKQLFINNYTALYNIGDTIVYKDKILGDLENTINQVTPKVYAINREATEKILGGKSVANHINIKENDLLAIKNGQSLYARYFIASGYDNKHIWTINDGTIFGSGWVIGGDPEYVDIGIRLVVELKFNLPIELDKENSYSGKNIWNLK